MLYFDTSAAVKLLRREAETDALVGWLNSRADPWVTSAITEVELTRALRRSAPRLLVQVPALLARLNRYDVDATVLATAAAYPDPLLRSMDAIHLATADAVFRPYLTGFVVYNDRLAAEATGIGLPVVSPGR